MKAYITAMGEPTIELAKWSLDRQGFDVEVIDGDSTLGEKLEYIYGTATEDFLRMDADVIARRDVYKSINYWPFQSHVWWAQLQTFDVYQMAVSNGGLQLYKKEALPILREHIKEYSYDDRPETRMWNLEEFKNPRRCMTYAHHISGIHGFGQKNIDRVESTKQGRKNFEVYDFEMARKLKEYYK